MKNILKRPDGRRAGWTVLAALLLTSHSLVADLGKGAARQRQLIRASATGAVASSAKGPAKCGACCSTNQAAVESVTVTTGTQIPSVSGKRGQITDGAQNLRVLDRRQLERTGATTVTDAVNRLLP